MSAPSDAVAAFDPLSDSMMADPYSVMEALRTEAPMVWIEKYNHWVALSFDLVHEILRDIERWSSIRASDDGIPRPVRDETRVLAARRGVPHVETLTSSDAPEHPIYRGIVARAMSARRIALMESRVREIVDMLIDDFPADGRVDFHEMFARRLPFNVVTELLGVPEEDKPLLFERGGSGELALLPGATDEQRARAIEDHLEVQNYLLSQFHDRRENPRDDLFTVIAQGIFEDRLLNDAELASLGSQILGGGQHTTVLILCSMMLLLLNRPDEIALLRDDPSRAANLFEECMRMEPPVQGLFRIAKTDMDIAGVHVKEGERVYLLYASANRDEAHFECPVNFEGSRANAKEQLGFGGGVHFCLGAPLARTEGRIAIERLFTRLPSLRVDEEKPLRYGRYYFLRGPHELHLRWDA